MSIRGTDFMLKPEKMEKEFMLVEITEWTDFVTKEKLGFHYVVLFPKLQYEKVKVSVKCNSPIVSKEELMQQGQIPITFDGLRTWASLYQNRLSLKAEARSVQKATFNK